MQSNKMNMLFKKGKHALELLKHYDKTRELLVGRKRLDITLSVEIIKKLKALSTKTKKPVSRIIEERIKEFSLPEPPALQLNAEHIPIYVG